MRRDIWGVSGAVAPQHPFFRRAGWVRAVGSREAGKGDAAKATSFYLLPDSCIDGLGGTRYNEPRKAPVPYSRFLGQEKKVCTHQHKL